MRDADVARVEDDERVEPAEPEDREEEHHAGHERPPRRQPAGVRLLVGVPRLRDERPAQRRHPDERRRHDPDEREPVVAEHERGRGRPEREPGVGADRDEARRLAVAVIRREVDRHRVRGDDERRLRRAGDDPHRHDDAERRLEREHQVAREHHERAREEHRLAPEPVGEPSGRRPDEDRADAGGAHREPDARVARVQHVARVERQRVDEEPEGREGAERRHDHEDERAAPQARLHPRCSNRCRKAAQGVRLSPPRKGWPCPSA